MMPGYRVAPEGQLLASMRPSDARTSVNRPGDVPSGLATAFDTENPGACTMPRKDSTARDPETAKLTLDTLLKSMATRVSRAIPGPIIVLPICRDRKGRDEPPHPDPAFD